MCLGVSNIEIKKSIEKDRNDLKRSFTGVFASNHII